MLAVECETFVENGIVKIHAKYRDIMSGDLKRILLNLEMETKRTDEENVSQLERSCSIIERGCDISSYDETVQWQREVR